VREGDEGNQEGGGAGGPAILVDAVHKEEEVPPMGPHQQPPPIIQETWADWSGKLVRKTYGQAAIEVTRGHHSQPLMVAAMLLFTKDLAKEVERVGESGRRGSAGTTLMQ
jgi:hypothetical protein